MSEKTTNIYQLFQSFSWSSFLDINESRNYQKNYNNQIENQKLAELRNWLLPMLMNGQVEVV